MATRLTALDALGATGTDATLESAVPSGDGEVSLSLLDSEALNVFDGEVCKGPEETGLTTTEEAPLDRGLDDDDAGTVEDGSSSDGEGVSNSGGGTYVREINTRGSSAVDIRRTRGVA